MKTNIQIILELAAFYAADPVGRRAFIPNTNESGPFEKGGGKGFCVYETRINAESSESKRCGVGHCMTDVAIEMYGGTEGGVERLAMAAGDFNDDDSEASDEELQGWLDSILKPEYRGHPLQFWENVQRFHDTADYWDETSLTPRGITYLNSLLLHPVSTTVS